MRRMETRALFSMDVNFLRLSWFYTALVRKLYGSFWLDGTNGNLGIEGLDVPLANLVVGIKAAAQQGQARSGWWRKLL